MHSLYLVQKILIIKDNNVEKQWNEKKILGWMSCERQENTDLQFFLLFLLLWLYYSSTAGVCKSVVTTVRTLFAPTKQALIKARVQ